MKKILFLLPIPLFFFLAASSYRFIPLPNNDWPSYLGGNDRNHYSDLAQIDTSNVSLLKPVWIFSTPDSGQMQTNPLIIDGTLYAVSPTAQLIALDAASGEEKWTFGNRFLSALHASRGVAYWTNGKEERILHTIGSYLYAVDAKTGKNISSFGDNGRVDLHTGLPANAQEKFIISTTPGTVFENLIIMPVRLSEGEDAAPGDIRAFDVLSGKLVWSFHTIPYPGELGYETFPQDAYKNEEIGGANNWAGMALDEKKGIVYVPTGSAAYDFYGGNREGENLFSNSLLALDARTGKRIWHYQTVHHDIWDRDLPAPPNLVTVRHKGKLIEAVAQVTKHGYIFLFDRLTGTPLFPIEETRVLTSTALPGEKVWPTQPRPTLPLPYARQAHTLTNKDISPYAPNQKELKKAFQSYKKGWFDPPSQQGTLILPGFDGGAEWGGAAVDPNGIMYLNSNEMAWVLTMKNTPKEEELASLSNGERVYQTYCAACHGEKRQGKSLGIYPNLQNIASKKQKSEVLELINKGKGMMPGFPTVSTEEKQAVIAFLYGDEKVEAVSTKGGKSRIPYKSTGYNKFLDANGLPAISPPWGTLQAIDLNTGQYLWKIPLGHEPTLAQKGIYSTGTENYGGPLVTKGGILLIAATKDGYFRAFHQKTGKLLWSYKLPAAAFATPATYAVNGKQYVVIACGGGKLGTPKGNTYLAFALPEVN